MEPKQADQQLASLAQALCDVRDLWVRMSLVLKDYLADLPSPIRDEVMTEVERHLARIRESDRGH
jgi:hypothetical protein